MDRREFLKCAATTLAAGKLLTGACTAGPGTRYEPLPGGEGNAARLARRPYGPHGIELGIVGFGGMMVKSLPQERVDRLVAESVERGVNFFDVSPVYGDAEERLGRALRPYRKDVFLACKTFQRTRDAGMAELERSLERLRTDYLDLYQLHAIEDVESDVDAAFARDGVMQGMVQAKREGRVRHLGFSAHSVQAAYAAMDRYDFDSLLVPVNFTCWYEGGFGLQILERARQRGVTPIALKPMARQRWTEGHPNRQRYARCWYEPLDDPELAAIALRWTLSQPITTAMPPGEEPLYRWALSTAADPRPLTDEEQDRLRRAATRIEPLFTAGQA